MRPIVSTSLMAILAAISITACSSSSNASNGAADSSASSAAADNSASSDNGAASGMSADNSAAAPAAAAGDVPLYPGAVTDSLPAKAGSPPPGGKSYSTADAPAKVQAWYTANVKNAVLKGSTPTGSMFLIGDAKTGTIVMVQADSGKTWILTGPASALMSK
jgi:hypothetical protein